MKFEILVKWSIRDWADYQLQAAPSSTVWLCDHCSCNIWFIVISYTNLFSSSTLEHTVTTPNPNHHLWPKPNLWPTPKPFDLNLTFDLNLIRNPIPNPNNFDQKKAWAFAWEQIIHIIFGGIITILLSIQCNVRTVKTLWIFKIAIIKCRGSSNWLNQSCLWCVLADNFPICPNTEHTKWLKFQFFKKCMSSFSEDL